MHPDAPSTDASDWGAVRRMIFLTNLRNLRRFYRPSHRVVLLRLLIPALIIAAGLLVGALFLDRPDMRPGWRGAGMALAVMLIGSGALALYMLALATLFPRAVRRVLMSNQRAWRGLLREHRRGLPPMWATGAAMFILLAGFGVMVELFGSALFQEGLDSPYTMHFAILRVLWTPVFMLLMAKWLPHLVRAWKQRRGTLSAKASQA